MDVLLIRRLQSAAILSDASDHYLSASSKRENGPFVDDQEASFGIDWAVVPQHLVAISARQHAFPSLYGLHDN